MRAYERSDTEAGPRWQVIELTGLRPLRGEMAAELRRSLPVRLAGIVREIDDAVLELEMFTDPDGMVEVRIFASAGAHTVSLVSELAAILQPVAELSSQLGEQRRFSEWPIVADSHSGRIGFVAESEEQVGAMPWQPAAEAHGPQLIEELATLPGHGLRARLCCADTSRSRWSVQLRAITEGEPPALRLRSTIRRRFPGLQIATPEHAPGARLLLDNAALPGVFAVPVANEDQLVGSYQAAPAPIATTPRREDIGGGLRIGHAVTGGGRQVSVELSEHERLRHIHVLGQTGTGKSSALAGIAHGLAQRSEGALIVDPHGRLCDRILAELPESSLDRVWWIRCGDIENPVPVNPLAESDPVRRDIAIAELCATFQYLFDPKETGIVGPRFTERVGMTLRALAAAHGTRASLLDVPIASENDSFMTAAVACSKDARLESWWKVCGLAKRSAEHGEVLAWVNSKFERFSSTVAMRAILGSGCNAIDFAEAMDGGRIILLDLSKSEIGEQASRLLGYLYLSRVWDAALRRQRRDRPFTVVVDEAHTLISGALSNMLSEGRKFGLSVVLAHQYLDQLDRDLRPAVDGNVATTIAFRCAVADAAELSRRFGDRIDRSLLVTLPDLSAVSLRTAKPGPSNPHTLLVDHNGIVAVRTGAELALQRDRIQQNTIATLVDPYRNNTAAAASGTSNIDTLPRPGADIERASSSVRRLGSSPPPAAASRPSSFLDEWLAKRADDSAQTEPTDA